MNATDGLEQCQWSPKTGKFYQNVPSRRRRSQGGAVAVIDPKTMKVEKSLPGSDRGLRPARKEWPSARTTRSCSAATDRRPMGIGIPSSSMRHSGAVTGECSRTWEAPTKSGSMRATATTSSPVATRHAARSIRDGHELLGVVDSTEFRLDQTVVIANQIRRSGDGRSRRIHSVAADPRYTNQVYVPIPATGGASPTSNPTLCAGAPNKVGTPTDATGCIAVFATTNDDRSRVAQERGTDDKQE